MTVYFLITDSLVFFDTSPPNGPLNVTHHDSKTPLELSYLAPQTKDELVTMVKSVATTYQRGGLRRKIRVLGSGHSWSAVAQSDDMLLSLCNYKVRINVLIEGGFELFFNREPLHLKFEQMHT